MNKGKRNALEKRRILAYVKKETAVFHKRVSVKTAVFLQPFRSIFHSIYRSVSR